MTDVAFVFEVHQPHRLRRSLFWEGKMFRQQTKEELFDYYFDNEVDREIFKRATRKCYFPSNQIILNTRPPRDLVPVFKVNYAAN
jgi:alpha-amylase/alpha-mannosidase (GH57 family)